MKRELFDIWEEENLTDPSFRWCAQLVNYVGRFRSRQGAESFAESAKKARTKVVIKSK
jgi:hypothetical protein